MGYSCQVSNVIFQPLENRLCTQSLRRRNACLNIFKRNVFTLFVKTFDNNNRILVPHLGNVFAYKIDLDPDRRLMIAAVDFHSDKSMKEKPLLVNYYFEENIFWGCPN
jgi:hypothetical protein